MYAALFHILFQVAPFILGAYAWIAEFWSGQRILLYLAPTIVVSLLTAGVKPIELKIRHMPVAEELREEFDYVVHIWLHRPFPKW